MRLEEFLAAHHLKEHPFVSAEEAQGDEILTRILEQNDFNFGHPGWAKFCGSPPGNQTSLVFGPKGSGKTAMRLALEKRIEHANENEPAKKALMILYADFNQYLDHWKARTEARNREALSFWARLRGHAPPPASLREHWTLSHHIDAMLCEMAKRLPTLLRHSPVKPSQWPEIVKHETLFLAAAYLPLSSGRYRDTMREVSRALNSPATRFSRCILAWLTRIGTLMIVPLGRSIRNRQFAKRFAARVDVTSREVHDTAWAFAALPGHYLAALPLLREHTRPANGEASHEERYDLLARVTAIASAAGCTRTVVVMDKVDEPMFIHGDTNRMADFIRPLLNNKLLQFKGLHFKMLLPYQLHVLRQKADSQSANQARLDKANVIHPFVWSGLDLYLILSERVAVCSEKDAPRRDLQTLFEEETGKDRVVAQLERLKTPRHANKFMDRLVRETCSAQMEIRDPAPPRIPASVFHRVCADMESEIRSDAQDLGEPF